MELDKVIQKMIFNIDKRVRQTTSKKINLMNYIDAEFLVEILDICDYTIDFPCSLYDNLNMYPNRFVEEKKRYLELYEDTYNTNIKIANLYDAIYHKYGNGFIENYKNYFSLEEVVDFAENFFDYYDTDIHKHFLDMKEKDRIFLNKGSNFGYDGYTFPINSEREVFVFAGGKPNIELISTLIHEIIHSYIEKNFFDISYEEYDRKDMNNLHEVYSEFIELVFIKYLKDINFCNNDINSLELSILASSINKLDYFKQLLDKRNKELVFNDPETLVDYIDTEAYAYSFNMAHLYLDRYLRNENKTKDELFGLSIESKDHNRHYMLDNYGLKEKKLGKSKPITNHIKEYYNY